MTTDNVSEERVTWVPGEMTEHLADLIYDAATRALRDNPYDGRTREGRAWATAAWRTYEHIRADLGIR